MSSRFLSRFNYSIQFWLLRRQKTYRQYARQALLLVDCGDDLSLSEHGWLHAGLAFTPSHIEVKIIDKNGRPPKKGLKDNIAYFYEHAPSHYLFLDNNRPTDTCAALRFLGVPYGTVRKLEPPEIQSEFPQEDKDRQSAHEMLGQRYAIYAHCSSNNYARELKDILKAYREARRDFPDLLLLISGVSLGQITQYGANLHCAQQSDDKVKRRTADIIYSNSNEPLLDWIAVSNVAVVMPGNRSISSYARQILYAGSALIVYGVDLEGDEDLRALEGSGTIGSVQKNGFLGAAISQALSPEKTALATVQSLNRITQTPSELTKTIDKLLSIKGEGHETA